MVLWAAAAPVVLEQSMVEDKLKELGLILPPPATPAFQYVPVTVHAGVAYVSGQLPKEGEEVRITGKVGGGVDLETAQRAARICILQGLSCLKAAIGSLDAVERVLKVTGFVASAPGFVQQPKVIDAASSLLVEVFGDRGRHARSAVGVAELPRNAPVEIEMVVAVNRE
jgi:enamine deaminase RidA (YjgF/YER057c/UK114 family)